MLKTWSESEIQFIYENFATKGSQYCAEKLDRTIESIRNKARRLNIARDMFTRYNKPNIPKGYEYCCGCKQILSESFFYKKTSEGIYGKKANICRSCCQDRARRSGRKHKSSSVEKYKSNPIKKILSNIKARAKKHKIPFDLDETDIVIPTYCPILGIPIIPFSKSDNSPSLDRLKPELGYIKGNVNIISNKANRIKNNASIEELEKIYLWFKAKLASIT